MKLDNKIWIVITVVVCGAVLAGGWVLGVSPFLATAAEAQNSLAQVSSQNTATQAQNAKLASSQAKSDELKAQLASLRKAVPEDVDGTAFINEVNGIAASTGTTVTSITLSDPVTYVSPAATAEAAAAAASGSGSTASPSASPSASATPTPAPTPTGPQPTTNSLITASNFVVVPVAIVVDGTLAQTSAFLHGLQYGDRLVLVTQLASTTEDAGGVELTITGSMYVLTPATPAAASTTDSSTSNG